MKPTQWLLSATAFVAILNSTASEASDPAARDALPRAQESVISLPGVGDVAGLYPLADYQTLETDHFRIAYDKPLEPLAKKTGQYLEEAHKFLTGFFQWEPWHKKTQVVLVDNQDTANGFASATLRIGLVLYVTPPDNWGSLYHYDDWLRLLAYHEYVHLLNMDTTKSFYTPIRWLVGDGFLPNSFWAPWMLEGLAVFLETRLTKAGRGRSAYYEMVLRAAVEENLLDTKNFITLDKVAGDNPYFPSGEIPYLFGYQLMNQVAKEKGAETLGTMSERSAHRVPYFINGNLENITGKDWYAYWAEWVEETKKRQHTSLETIKKQPTTKFQKLTDDGFGVLGSAASPDGKLVAYSQESLHRRYGLYLKELDTGRIRRLHDKLLGVGMAFTSDSRHLFFSALRRRSPFFIHSDIASYDLKTDRWVWLTDHLRARDPDISKDGKSVVFTVTEAGVTGLAMASLEFDGDGKPKLGPIQTLYMPPMLDRVSNPKFSPEGGYIVFTLHKNGENSEGLYSIDPQTKEIEVLIRNDHYNRFPGFDSNGQLHVVSDRTGVDNLYRVVRPSRAFAQAGSSRMELEQVTNFTTGVWLPTFGPAGKSYGSVLSSTGWDLTEFERSRTPLNSLEATVQRAPAPAIDIHSETHPASIGEATSTSYTPWQSLIPRVWAPRLFVDPNQVYAGITVAGFDAVDRHRYLLGIAYDSLVQKPDLIVAYNNRSFGPTLALLAQNYTTQTRSYADGSISDYVRRLEASAQISYNFRGTFSVFTPTIGVNATRDYRFFGDDQVAASYYTPSGDIRLGYSDVENTRLGISPESGRSAVAGVRTYLESGKPLTKGVFSYTEYFRIFSKHTILLPNVQAMTVSHRSRKFGAGNTVLEGRPQEVLRDVPTTSFDSIGVRGYPGNTFFVRQAALGALDLRFPLGRIFRGWGTNPVFLENLSGFVFGEGVWLPFEESGISTFTAAGGGLKLSSTVFHRVPILLSLEYHQGFKTEIGGQGELFATMNLGVLPF